MAEEIPQYKNIHLFIGKPNDDIDIFSLDTELSRRISAFRTKFGKDSVDIYSSENRNAGLVTQSIFSGGLFLPKKLIVIKGLPKSAEKDGFNAEMIESFTENIMNNAKNIPPDNLVIFVNYAPDRRLKFFKFLEKSCTVKTFGKKTPSELRQFIRSELGNISISDALINKILDIVGTNLYRIYSECDKLKEYCTSKNISEISDEIIDDVVFGLTDTNSFHFLELAFKDKTQAIKYLEKIEFNGTNRNEFAGALYSQLRSSLLIQDCYEKGIKKQSDITNKTGLVPGAVYANLKNIDNIQKNCKELKNMYKLLVQTDVDIKNGKADESQFWLNAKKKHNKL